VSGCFTFFSGSTISGFDVLKQRIECGSDIPVIVISGTGEIDDVIKALRLGAWDYLTKPITSLSILKHAVDRATENLKLMQENKQYHDKS